MSTHLRIVLGCLMLCAMLGLSSFTSIALAHSTQQTVHSQTTTSTQAPQRCRRVYIPFIYLVGGVNGRDFRIRWRWMQVCDNPPPIQPRPNPAPRNSNTGQGGGSCRLIWVPNVTLGGVGGNQGGHWVRYCG